MSNEMTLVWVIDSPFSRAIKWLLINKDIHHKDHLLTWQDMPSDNLLAKNPKKQVPTLLKGNNIKTDALLIALDYLPKNWHQSKDAQMYRLADCDVEAAIIFLFRANLLKEKFGESAQSQLMLESGINTYQQSVDMLLDHLFEPANPVNIGAVLLYSTLLASISLAESKLIAYRHQELVTFASNIESDPSYQHLISQYQASETCSVPFQLSQNT